MPKKRPYTMFFLPHPNQKVRRFTLPVFLLILVPSVIVLMLAAILWIIFRMHEQNLHQAKRFEQLLAQQQSDWKKDVADKNSVIQTLQNQIIDLSQQADEVGRKLNQLEQFEQQINKITGSSTASKSNSPVQYDNSGGQGGDSHSVSILSVHHLSQHTQSAFTKMSKQMADLQDRMSSAKAELQRQQHLRAITPSIWPTTARIITSPFGFRSDPFTGKPSFHDGIDIGGHWGDPVVAAADGKVEFAGSSSERGNYILINHGNGLKTYYLHLSKLLVTKGEHVSKGERIGRLGTTGRSTGPHLHYGITKNGKFVNPMKYLPRS